MTRIIIASELGYQLANETSFLFQISVMKNPHQSIVSESLVITPECEIEELVLEPSGNRMHRILAPAGQLTVRYDATVDLDQARADPSSLDEKRYGSLPVEVLPFLNPSRYCESDRLMHFALAEFGNMAPGYGRVQAIVDWVNAELSYVSGSTGPSTTACDVLLQRTGVCRDYAHVAIALCRAMGVPARYVAGYAAELQPPDFHGFFEAWLGDDWFLFDATRLAPMSGLVRIGTGRDAADVSFATLIGSADSAIPMVSAVFDGGNKPDLGSSAVSGA